MIDTEKSRPERWARISAAMVFTLAVGLFGGAMALFIRTDGLGREVWTEGLVGMGVWLFAFGIVGMLIAFQRPWNVIGWICLAFSLVWGIWFLADRALHLEAHIPGSLSNPELIAALAYPLWVPAVGLIPFLFLLFPNGRLLSPRWRPLALVLGIDLALLTVTAFFLPGLVQDTEFENPMGIEALAPFYDGIPAYLLVLTLVLCIIAAAISVFIRFRRAVGVERLQLKWLATAAVISALGYAALFFQDYTVQLVWALIPIAIGFAMQRHRLYDIDRLISRTATYAIVVVLLGLVYAGTIFLLTELLPLETSASVAGSTLTIAALFHPLRRRIQQTVDRAFNRSRYDARLVIEDFEKSLQNRVELGDITRGLAEVVSTTMQPTVLAVWTPSGPSRAEGAPNKQAAP